MNRFNEIIANEKTTVIKILSRGLFGHFAIKIELKKNQIEHMVAKKHISIEWPITGSIVVDFYRTFGRNSVNKNLYRTNVYIAQQSVAEGSLLQERQLLIQKWSIENVFALSIT